MSRGKIKKIVKNILKNLAIQGLWCYNKITETEELIKTLELEIQNPEIVANYVLLNEKCDLLTEQKNLLSELMDEWCILNE